MELVGLFLIVFVFIPMVLIWGKYDNHEAGTVSERKKNPELNIANSDLHWDRLNEYGRSKYKRTIYYMVQKGGFTISKTEEKDTSNETTKK